MPEYTVNKEQLRKVNLPLPSFHTIADSIFDKNKDGFKVYKSSKYDCTVVECKNKPRDMPVYAWGWIEL